MLTHDIYAGVNGMTTFFESKKAAAILKHAILDGYVDPFTMKTGSTSKDNRVAFLDGYAGEGRYADGSEGSPALLMRKAHALKPRRSLESYLVEQEMSVYEQLESVVAEMGEGLTVRVYFGDVTVRLASVLEATADIPLFVFLDPYGLMIAFESLQPIFDRPRGLGAPATEVLINFNASALRHFAGHLTSPKGQESMLHRMDIVCGGDWWREVWRSQLRTGENTERAEEAVIGEYARRLGAAAGAGSWSADVRNRPQLRTAYYLIFLSRHRDGLYLFGEALSLGLGKWRKALLEAENQGSLLNESSFKDNEKALKEAWVDEIERNLRTQLGQGQAFVIRERSPDVMGDSLGKARQTHLREAWKRLYADGATSVEPKGELLDKTITPG